MRLGVDSACTNLEIFVEKLFMRSMRGGYLGGRGPREGKVWQFLLLSKKKREEEREREGKGEGKGRERGGEGREGIGRSDEGKGRDTEQQRRSGQDSKTHEES